MVGGVVINVVQVPDGTWIQCLDTTYSDDTCAIRVEKTEEVKAGDRLWWQGNRAYWTPKPDDGREDVILQRIGYSHRSIPDEVMKVVEGQ